MADQKFTDLHPDLRRPKMDALATIVTVVAIEVLGEALAALAADKREALVARVRANCTALAAQVVARAPAPLVSVAREQADATAQLLEIVLGLAADRA